MQIVGKRYIDVKTSSNNVYSYVEFSTMILNDLYREKKDPIAVAKLMQIDFLRCF